MKSLPGFGSGFLIFALQFLQRRFDVLQNLGRNKYSRPREYWLPGLDVVLRSALKFLEGCWFAGPAVEQDTIEAAVGLEGACIDKDEIVQGLLIPCVDGGQIGCRLPGQCFPHYFSCNSSDLRRVRIVYSNLFK
jgi:hypothetical protein